MEACGLHAGTCGAGESFLLEAGVPYMFSNICKRYYHLLAPNDWMDVRSSPAVHLHHISQVLKRTSVREDVAA